MSQFCSSIWASVRQLLVGSALVCFASPQLGFSQDQRGGRRIVLRSTDNLRNAANKNIYNLDPLSGQLVNKLFWTLQDGRLVRAIEKAADYVLCGDFHWGRAVAARMEGNEVRFGAIDSIGRFRIPSQFWVLEDFHDGRALATTDGGDGLIDVDGRWVVEAGMYSEVGQYSEGLCTFVSDGRFGLLDLDGEVVVGPQFPATPGFGEGLGLVRDHAEQLWRYIMKRGDTVLSVSMRHIPVACHFSDSVARVMVQEEQAVGEGSDRRWGFIDVQGRFAIRPMYGSAGDFSEGLAAVCQGNPGDFDPAGVYHRSFLSEPGKDLDNVQEAQTSKSLWGFINLKGQLVIPMQFEEVRYFHEGFAAFRSGRQWGYIDRQGRVAITPQFDAAERFRNGYAAVSLCDDEAFIDYSGHVVLKTEEAYSSF